MRRVFQPHVWDAENGQRCTVGHGDGEGGCLYCSACGEWVRPSRLKDPCPARNALQPGEVLIAAPEARA